MELFCILIFGLSYLAIVFEHSLGINKAAPALLGGVLCWLLIFVDPATALAHDSLMESMAEIAGILFFLLGAMTIVELIDSHDGFALLRSSLRPRKLSTLVWIVSALSFVLSALIDNLTTSIVMASLCAPLLPTREDRWSVAALVILTANAGGAWSPTGDVTTTMLWIGNNLSAQSMIVHLFLPSLVCALIPTWWIARSFAKRTLASQDSAQLNTLPHAKSMLVAGLSSFACVPILKTLTHLPPFAIMLLMLAFMWILTSVLHRSRTQELKQKLSVAEALQRIDTPSILFFLGILLSIAALQKLGSLNNLATWFALHLPDPRSVAIALGFLSAFIDNIPLVAAAQGMYPLSQMPTDHVFWNVLALSTATGGSIIIIGSAAGVAMMGQEDITFLWYLRRIAPIAFVSMTGGIAFYLVQHALFF